MAASGTTGGMAARQALYSYRLSFRFTTDAGPLEPLNGRSWQVEEVDFVQEYFPGFSLPRTEG